MRGKDRGSRKENRKVGGGSLVDVYLVKTERHGGRLAGARFRAQAFNEGLKENCRNQENHWKNVLRTE